jgi:hypothetical protein
VCTVLELYVDVASSVSVIAALKFEKLALFNIFSSLV